MFSLEHWEICKVESQQFLIMLCGTHENNYGFTRLFIFLTYSCQSPIPPSPLLTYVGNCRMKRKTQGKLTYFAQSNIQWNCYIFHILPHLNYEHNYKRNKISLRSRWVQKQHNSPTPTWLHAAVQIPGQLWGPKETVATDLNTEWPPSTAQAQLSNALWCQCRRPR